MDFAISEEHNAITDLAAKVFREHGSDEHVRALADAGVTLDMQLWRTLTETGLVQVALPEAHGGSGMGLQELGLVLQQQGRYLGAAPLWTHALVTLAIATHGAPSLQQRALPGLASCAHIAALGTESHAAGSLRATKGTQGWTLHGRLDTVLLDEHPAFVLAPATTAEGVRLFLVPTDAAGMSRVDGLLTDMQVVCDLGFDGVVLPLDMALDTAAIEWLTPRVACCISAYQLGVLEEALRRAAAYVSERTQFGRPLGTFQAIAVRAADSYIEVELLRSALFQLAWRIDHDLPAAAAGRVAKHQASHAGHVVGHTVQHFHGGVGADLQYPIHRFYLKSQALSHIGGSAEGQLAHIGKALASASPQEYLYE